MKWRVWIPCRWLNLLCIEPLGDPSRLRCFSSGRFVDSPHRGSWSVSFGHGERIRNLWDRGIRLWTISMLALPVFIAAQVGRTWFNTKPGSLIFWSDERLPCYFFDAVSKGRCVYAHVFWTSSYLVDPASSHMLVSKIKPCMSKYKQICTVKLRMAH